MPIDDAIVGVFVNDIDHSIRLENKLEKPRNIININIDKYGHQWTPIHNETVRKN